MTTTRLGLMLLAAIGLTAAGCSGGSDGDAKAGGATAGGRGKVTVTVVSTIGEPVAGANVDVVHWRDDKPESGITYKAITDASGRAEVTGVRRGRVLASASHGEFSSANTIDSRDVVSGGTLNLELRLPPKHGAAGGVVEATAAPGGVSADGKVLEFSLQIVDLPGPYSREWDAYRRVEITACNPQSGNDAPMFRADCVSGPEGFDAPYTADSTEAAVPLSRVWPTSSQSGARAPFAAALLIDQSAAYAAGDPADRRLRAAKHFLDGANEQEPVLLGAFAADRPVSSQYSLLPSRPVSIFPLENPQFTTSGRSLFSTVDSLATMEGGAASLLAAVDRVLDVMATSGGSGRRDIVVLTNGQDETCGTRAACARLRDAVVAKARALQVRIVTVGVQSEGVRDLEMLGLLAQAAEGSAAFWADEPALLPHVLRVVRDQLGAAQPSVKAAFRIRSPVAGAFAPGRTVTGWVVLTIRDCGVAECTSASARLPFAVRIP